MLLIYWKYDKCQELYFFQPSEGGYGYLIFSVAIWEGLSLKERKLYCRKQGERIAKCLESFSKSGVPRATHGTPRAMPCHVSLKTWHGVARLLEFWTWHGTPRATFFQNVAWHGTGIFFRARRGTRHAPRAPPSLWISNIFDKKRKMG